MFVLLFASFETTFLAITVAVKLLRDNPREGHENILRNRENKESGLTWTEYKSMTFTFQLINETIRLANIVPGVFRKALKDIKFKVCEGDTIPSPLTGLGHSTDPSCCSVICGQPRSVLCKTQGQVLSGSAIGNVGHPNFSKGIPITLKHRKNCLDLLSLTVGLQGACIMGLVELEGLTDGSAVDLPSQQWTYQIGLKGKALGLETDGLSLWVSGSPKSQPLTWYKTSPEWGKAGRGSTVKALDVIGLLILLQLAVAHIYYEGRNVVIDFVN